MLSPRRILGTITLLVIALATVATVGAASPAFAYPAGDGPPQGVPIPVPAAPVVSQVSYGSPIWVFGLVAAVTAAFTVAAVLLSRRLVAKQPSNLLNV